MRECTWEDVKRRAGEISITSDEIKSSDIVFFGAALNGDMAVEELRGELNIRAFADNNSALWGTTFAGYEVIPPENLKSMENVIVIITSTGHHYSTINAQLENLGVKHLTYAEFLMSEHFDRFEYVYEKLLSDEVSRRAYRNVMMANLEGDMEYIFSVYTGNQYFGHPRFGACISGEVFADCGACTGDIIEQYLFNRFGNIGRIYAFEPVENTYKALNIRRERLIREWALDEDQIVTVKKAVSDIEKCVSISSPNYNKNTSSHLYEAEGTDGSLMETISLDRYFEDKEKPTFIKADIEGSERDMILGARGILLQNKPRLAVCIYHGIADMYRLPILIHEINHEYKMAVLQHSPSFCETVLYCW
jgi:FkbM family methyltransferase